MAQSTSQNLIVCWTDPSTQDHHPAMLGRAECHGQFFEILVFSLTEAGTTSSISSCQTYRARRVTLQPRSRLKPYLRWSAYSAASFSS
jgi:hypothetical protein